MLKGSGQKVRSASARAAYWGRPGEAMPRTMTSGIGLLTLGSVTAAQT